jgi:concanavalin A-like lectin/glucanase superfamily protein
VGVTLRRTLWALTAVLVASCGGSSSKTGPNGDAGSSDASAAAASLREGLAGAWSFDVDGTDHSGNKLDLGVAGIKLVTGRFGKGLQFAGMGSVAQRPLSDAALDLATGDFTVSCWLELTATDTAQFVAIKGYADGGWFVGWAKTAWAFGLGTPPTMMGKTFPDPSGTPASGFHHIVLQRSGTLAEMIVDSHSVGTTIVADSAAPSPEPFQIGGYAPGGVGLGQSVVNGVVDDVAIWHRALISAELDYLDTHPVP